MGRGEHRGLGRPPGASPREGERQGARRPPRRGAGTRCLLVAPGRRVSGLPPRGGARAADPRGCSRLAGAAAPRAPLAVAGGGTAGEGSTEGLSLIHISEPTRLGMISYAVFCLK